MDLSPFLLVLLAPYFTADMAAAARELARAVSTAVAHESVSLTLTNKSALAPAHAAEIRRIFESELKSAASPAAEVHLTISENLTAFLLVAEIRRNADRQVILESWPRDAVPSTPDADGPLVTLEKKPLWEQDAPILDAAQTATALLVLDPTRVLLVRGDDRQSVPIPSTHPWPRDPRGRLSVTDTAFTAYLPGTICRGAIQPRLSLDCQDSQDPWLLAPGALALFASDRNLFQGRIDLAPGGQRDLPAFYSAAPAGDTWIFAAADGRARVYSGALEIAGAGPSAIDQWGSDIAAVQTPCGPRILATRPSGTAAPDAVRPYDLAGGTPNPAGPPLEFSGSITALWSAGNSATAVSRDLQTGRYAAFSLAPACGS